MINSLEKILQNNGIRPTAMRLLVLDFLTNKKAAVGISDLEKNFENSDRITLYRTIKTFEENKLIHSINDGTGVTKYALCEEGCECDIHHDLHVHFHCRVCQETFCLPKYKIPVIPLPSNFKQEEANLVVKGICSKCA